MNPEDLVDQAVALFQVWTWPRHVGLVVNLVLAVLIAGVALGAGVGVWMLIAKVLFSSQGLLLGLPSRESSGIAVVLFILAELLSLAAVVAACNMLSTVIIWRLLSSHSATSPLGQFALGVFAGRLRRRRR